MGRVVDGGGGTTVVVVLAGAVGLTSGPRAGLVVDVVGRVVVVGRGAGGAVLVVAVRLAGDLDGVVVGCGPTGAVVATSGTAPGTDAPVEVVVVAAGVVDVADAGAAEVAGVLVAPALDEVVVAERASDVVVGCVVVGRTAVVGLAVVGLAVVVGRAAGVLVVVPVPGRRVVGTDVPVAGVVVVEPASGATPVVEVLEAGDVPGPAEVVDGVGAPGKVVVEVDAAGSVVVAAGGNGVVVVVVLVVVVVVEPGAEVTGAEVTGDEVTGAEVTGDEVTGDEVTGAEVTGAEVTGDEVTGAEVTGDEVVVVEELVVVPKGLVVVAAGVVVETVASAEAGLPDPMIRTAETASGAMQMSVAAMSWLTRGFEFFGGLAMGTNLGKERSRQTQPAGHA